MTAAIIIVVLGIGGFLAARLFVIEQISPRPSNLGVTDGKLTDCPGTPNCVNSQAAGGYAAIDPIAFNGDAAVAKDTMLRVIREMDNSEIIEERENYIYAEFRSTLWGFIDDVEFYFDGDAGVIEFRSASRLGVGDMQANRQRMMDVRRRFDAATP